MLPDLNKDPAFSSQPLPCICVPRAVSFDLRHPITGVLDVRALAMEVAAVPEAAVHLNAYLCRTEHDVNSPPGAGHDLRLEPEPETHRVEDSAEHDLGAGVLVPLLPHPRGNAWG